MPVNVVAASPVLSASSLREMDSSYIRIIVYRIISVKNFNSIGKVLAGTDSRHSAALRERESRSA